MNNKRLSLKLTGILLIAVMAAACSKKAEEQKAPEPKAAESRTEMTVMGEPDKPEANTTVHTAAVSVVTPSAQLQGSGTAQKVCPV